MEKTPLETYAFVQPLVRKDISDAALAAGKEKQYSVVKVQGHTHNTVDSPPVEFSNLASVQYFAMQKTVALSPAQVKALFTTAIQLVPPPQTSRGVIIVDGITVRLAFATTAYTGANPLEFRYTSVAGQQVAAQVPSTFLNLGASSIAQAQPTTGYFLPVPGGSGLNGRIVVCMENANPGAGDSQVLITVKYHLVAFQV